jgi:hypothetical protein
MPVIAPKKISERSRLRMLARQLNCDGKNFTISNPRSPQGILLINLVARRNRKHGKCERQIPDQSLARPLGGG